MINKVSIDEIYPLKKNIYPTPFVNQKGYLCDGEIREWNGPTTEVYSPICLREDETVNRVKLGEYPSLNAAAAIEALSAAVRAYDRGNGEWPQMSVDRRINSVLLFADMMNEHRKEVVQLLMWEIGKSQEDSEKEFDRTIEYIKATCNAMADLERASSHLEVKDGFVAQIRRSPLGVVLCMGPFNYPLNETFTTLIPALIMGNTVVFKPAKFGVLIFEPLLECFAKSFPKGVVNTVYGEGEVIISPIMASGMVDSLAFIGSSKVANILKKQHPALNRMRAVLGLQAKNVGIVTNSCNIEEAVKECVIGALSYNGQRCTALKLIMVDNAIKEEFTKKFCDRVDKMTLGMPWSLSVNITPMPENDKVKKMIELVEDACGKGAKIVNNGGAVKVGKTIMAPVVLDMGNEITSPVRTSRIWTEEQFGPVVPIVGFSDIHEPIEVIEASDYGQQASIFCTDIMDTSKLIDALSTQVSRININTQCQRGPDSFPFTGRKDSAEGTLSVTDALKVFSIRALVAAKLTHANKELVKGILRANSSNFLTTDFLLT